MGVPEDLEPGMEEQQRPTKRLPPRVQSPSSILTYRQCPRKYYYRYVAKLPSGKTIHLIRGSITHKVLESFYDANLGHIPDGAFPVTAKVLLHELLRKEWGAAQPELRSLGLSAAEIGQYHEETKVMINNFFHYLMDRIAQFPGMPLALALARIKPRREIELVSRSHHVRGFADAIHEHDGKTYILDYKTSSKCEMTPDYRLQLSIYGMIYAELSRLPDEVGIFFLKHGQEVRLPMTKAMAQSAQEEVHNVHAKTGSTDIHDYPMHPGPLCKWSTGQCDYYELCFGNKKITDFSQRDLVQIGKR